MALAALFVLVVLSGAADSSISQTKNSHTLNSTDIEPSTGICLNSPQAALAVQFEKRRSHEKRNAFNLYYMIEECTKCSAWGLLGHGNYCGLGGAGTPIDNIDRCCQKHDHCYDAVIEQHACWRFNVYILPYDWKVHHGVPYCGDETNECRRQICHCDKELTDCLNRVGCP